MTFQSNPKVDDESRHRPAVTIGTYHYKIHEGWAFEVGVTSQITDLGFLTFCTPADPNTVVHMLVDFAGEKGVFFELWENVIPPIQTPTLATLIVIGLEYTIETKGTTDFTLIGASSNDPGTTFTATAAGLGTGTVLNTVKRIRKKNRKITAPHNENVYAFINDMKRHMNAHAADITQHTIADTVNFPILTPDATDVASCVVLTTALQTAYVAHHADALTLLGGVNHIGQFIGTAGTLILTAPPTTVNESKFIAEELQRRYNVHDNSLISHTIPGIHSFGRVFGGSLSTSQNGTATLATLLSPLTTGERFTILLPGTTDFTLLGAKDSLPGTIFTHNGVIGLGTGTVNGHHLGVATFGTTILSAFTGGEKIVERFSVKATNAPDTGEYVLKHNTCYGVKVFDPLLNIKPLGFSLTMFEVPEV